jgi:FkbM family methyltransferase
MGLLDQLKKPEYLFRPSQIITRFRRQYQRPNRFEEMRLPWGMRIKYQSDEIVGRALWTVGIVDPTVSEVIWRLTDPGETTVDVGANIGYVTGLLAARVGPRGKVIAFEPHPETFQLLGENVAVWRRECGARIEPYQMALSDRDGDALLGLPPGFNQDRAMASLNFSSDQAAATFPVKVRRMDGLVKEPVGLMKLDVEGHELQALGGVGDSLSRRQIRDIIFEEHGTYPTPVTDFLEGLGYTLFSLGQRILGPKATAIRDGVCHRRWDSRSCLATAAPDRALARLSKSGWETLRTQGRSSR